MANRVPGPSQPSKALGDVVELAGWLPPRELSPNARVHHMAKARHTKATRQTIWGAVKHAEWPEQPARGAPRLLRITLRKKGVLLDDDNAVAWCKAVIDGVFDAGALYSDARQWCRLEVRQEKGEPCTTLELFEEGPA